MTIEMDEESKKHLLKQNAELHFQVQDLKKENQKLKDTIQTMTHGNGTYQLNKDIITRNGEEG